MAFVFVGTYSEPILFGTGQIVRGRGEGIHVLRFDPRSGALAAHGVARGVRNPSYIVLDRGRRFLYCVNELKEFGGRTSGAASAFRIDPEAGALHALGASRATHGTDPCHLAIDATGRHLLVANFAGGSVCVLPIQADGSLGEASQVIVHQGASVDPVRQQGPHPHAVAIDNANRFVLVPDLGIDKVMIYELDPAAGMLRPNPAQPFVATAAGAGPRQLVLHRNGELAYLINELDSTVTCYRYDHERGTLSELQTQSTLPIGFAGRSTCAEVAMSPCGRFLYGSNRGHDSIAIFAVDGVTGLLEARGHVSTRGATPRHFTVSPDGAWLIVANQDGGDVLVFRVDLTTGVPVWAGRRVEVGTPVCVQIL